MRPIAGTTFEIVMTNPPFGKKSSVTVTNGGSEEEKQALTIVRNDFWASSSSKQLNFVQHVSTLLRTNGRAAVVVPDNVLFEGGAAEIIRRKLLQEYDLHTLLRLPTGVFYAQSVKASVLFFDRRGLKEGTVHRTSELWIYDLRTNVRFTLRTRPIKRSDLDEFVHCYRAKNRQLRKPTWSKKTPDGRWRAFSYEELAQRDKVSLDIFWLKDTNFETSDSLPNLDLIAGEIAGDLRAALEQFERIQGDLERALPTRALPALSWT